MNFLVLWLGSTAFSLCIEAVREFRMRKDIADAGYKYEFKKFSSFVKEAYPGVNIFTFLSVLIPIYNILNAIQNDLNYKKTRCILLEQLYIRDALDKMSKSEKKEYQKKPTGLNAVLLPIKMKWKFKNAPKIKLLDGSVVYFDFEDNEMLIYKAYGPISILPEEEQKQRIKEACIKIGKAILNKHDNIDEFVEDIKASKNGTLKLSQTNLDNSKNTINQHDSREDKINELKNLKDELLQGQKEVVDKPYERERKK